MNDHNNVDLIDANYYPLEDNYQNDVGMFDTNLYPIDRTEILFGHPDDVANNKEKISSYFKIAKQTTNLPVINTPVLDTVLPELGNSASDLKENHQPNNMLAGSKSFPMYCPRPKKADLESRNHNIRSRWTDAHRHRRPIGHCLGFSSPDVLQSASLGKKK